MNSKKHPLFTALDKVVEQLKEQLQKRHDLFVKTTVVSEARNYAAKRMPNKSESSIEPFLTTIRAHYAGEKKEVEGAMNGAIQRALASMNITTANQKIESITKDQQNIMEKVRHLLLDKDKLHVSFDTASYERHRLLLALFGMGESMWNAAFFVKIGDILLSGLIIGIIVGLAQIIGVKVTVQIIKDIPNKSKRRKYAYLAAIGFAFVSVVLATARYWLILPSHGTIIPIYAVSPLLFTVINLLLMAATALMVYRFFPSRLEVRQIAAAKKIDGEIKALEKQYKDLQTGLIDLQNEREILIEYRVTVLHCQKMLLEKIDALYAASIGIFKEENVTKRSDGIFPDCFRDPHELLPGSNPDDFLLVS